MGACESLLNTEKDKIGFKDKNKQTNKGPNLFSAQIDSSQKNTIFFFKLFEINYVKLY